MIRIVVKAPTKSKNFFSFSLHKRQGGGVMKSSNPVSVYRRLENRLKKVVLGGSSEDKINVLVKYSHWMTNEGNYATKREALYALACFMEDYLPEKFANIRYKRYHK